jgi:hypothetical protein
MFVTAAVSTGALVSRPILLQSRLVADCAARPAEAGAIGRGSARS